MDGGSSSSLAADGDRRRWSRRIVIWKWWSGTLPARAAVGRSLTAGRAAVGRCLLGAQRAGDELVDGLMDGLVDALGPGGRTGGRTGKWTGGRTAGGRIS